MNLLFETKYALRLLRKAPGYTATCIFVTSVGIAVSLIVFTIIYTLSYKPLKYAGSENWYSLMFSMEGGLFRNTDDYFYQRLTEHDFQNFVVVGRQYGASSVIGDGDVSRRVSAGYISASLINSSTVQPLLGRLFQNADDAPDSSPTALLSYEAWQVYYQGDPDIVGRTSRIDGKAHTVIGVLPQGFNLGFAYDIWLPEKQLSMTAPPPYGRGSPILAVKRDADLKAATLEVNQIFSQLKTEFPEVYDQDDGVLLTPANSLGPGANSLYGMMSVVATIFVLLSCLNTGALLFTNTLRRQRELAIRNAMGSSGWQLLKQSLFESFCICFLGSVIGVLLAHISLTQIARLTSSLLSSGGVNNHHHYILILGWQSVLFAVSVMLVMWLLSGLIPVSRAVRLIPKSGLESNAKGIMEEGRSRTASILTGFQIVFSCFLLIVSGVIVSVMSYASQRNLGIDSDQVLTAHIFLSERFDRQEQKLSYLNDFEGQLSIVPGVQTVGFVSYLPSLQDRYTKYRLEDRNMATLVDLPSDPVAFVSDNYFNTLGINILAGRPFDSNDNRQSLPVAIIDERLAQRYWPGETALGKRIQLDPENNGEWLTIVGVTSHVLGSIRYLRDTGSFIYRPIYQSVPRDLRLVLKYEGTFSDLLTPVNRAATLANRDLPLSLPQTLKDYYLTQNAMSFMVMFSRIFMYIAIATGALAIIGIFAVFTRNIIRRSREFGIRRSLGDSKGNIVWLHLKKGVLFSTAGCGCGLSLALLFMGAFSGSSIGSMTESVPLSLIIGGVLASLVVCILLATYLPARKAVTTEPGDALRYE